MGRKPLKPLRRKRHCQNVKLTCKYCGKEMLIHVNDKRLYTEEVQANWWCGFCKEGKPFKKSNKNL